MWINVVFYVHCKNNSVDSPVYIFYILSEKF
jgi:hypothetical protein